MNKQVRRKKGFGFSGERYGKLTILHEAERIKLPSGQKPRRFICKCDCGNETNVLALHLVRGRIISCGCVTKTLNGESSTPIYRCYKAIKDRCAPNAIDRHRYYERGISMCQEWTNDYFSFKKWALENGFKKELQIDRIDNSKGYSPDNCRFVTNKENVNNRDNTFYVIYKNEKISFSILCDKLKIPNRNIPAIRSRILRGWNHDLAFDAPIRIGNYAKKVI